ncbi:MAG: hypothetical protein B6240_05330 [Desulfobacteraceae bacterium 4572_87]|nr:MAG: hypothetical protein B6240_05330 [Desulfobacteraceae bacterium 4572_87]
MRDLTAVAVDPIRGAVSPYIATPLGSASCLRTSRFLNSSYFCPSLLFFVRVIPVDGIQGAAFKEFSKGIQPRHLGIDQAKRLHVFLNGRSFLVVDGGHGTGGGRAAILSAFSTMPFKIAPWSARNSPEDLIEQLTCSDFMARRLDVIE